MEKIKKLMVESTTADSPENLSQQEITITNAEKEITSTLEREHVMNIYSLRWRSPSANERCQEPLF